MVPVNENGQKAIADLIGWHKQKFSTLDLSRPLFVSRKKGRLDRTPAHRVLSVAYQKASLNGKLATHSLRKSFAQRIYDVTSDIYLVKELLGHKEVETTREYLGVSYQKMQKAVESIKVDEYNTQWVLLHSQHIDRSDDAHQLKASLKIIDSQLQRKDQIIDRLTRIIEHQAAFLPVQPAEGNDDKVIPIDVAIRARQR